MIVINIHQPSVQSVHTAYERVFSRVFVHNRIAYALPRPYYSSRIDQHFVYVYIYSYW